MDDLLDPPRILFGSRVSFGQWWRIRWRSLPAPQALAYPANCRSLPLDVQDMLEEQALKVVVVRRRLATP